MVGVWGGIAEYSVINIQDYSTSGFSCIENVVVVTVLFQVVVETVTYFRLSWKLNVYTSTILLQIVFVCKFWEFATL